MPDVPKPIENRGYTLEFEDDFGGAELDGSKWLPFYLPQWASRAATATRYRMADSCLVLQIEEGQPAWLPEGDGEVRVSSVQTGVFAGPKGSIQGQHRFNKNLFVAEEQTPEKLYTPHFGYFEARLKAPATPNGHVAFWMIGYGERTGQHGEINVCEIKGAGMREWQADIGYGIRANGDSSLQDSFFVDDVLVDAYDFHTYAVEWMPKRVDFFIDGKRTRTIPQAPDYPMQLMLSIYEDPSQQQPSGRLPDPGYPREFAIDWVRGWKRTLPPPTASAPPAAPNGAAPPAE